MNTSILAFVLLAISSAAKAASTSGAKATCGTPIPGLKKIIDGADALRDLFPWQLILEKDISGTWALECGAAIIESTWAITAAHCVEDQTNAMRILAGVYDRNELLNANQIRDLAPSEITVHPEYDAANLINDIAILHWTDPLDFSTPSIMPICLPPDADSSYIDNPNCFITGFGLTTVNGAESMILQSSGTDVITDANCELRLGHPVLAGEVCTLDQVSLDVTICDGDMGGPLSCVVNTQFFLAGVGSFPSVDCNPRSVQVFTSIPYYVDWIRSVTGIPF